MVAVGNRKISADTSAGGLTGTEVVPVVRGTSNLRSTTAAIANWPSLSDFGIVANSSTNYGNADYQVAFAGVVAAGRKELFVPAGNYRWGEQISLHHGITIVGENASSSVFQFYHTGSGFVADGSVENGGGLKNLSIVNDTGSLAIAYVQLVSAVGGTSPDYFTIDGCNFTGFTTSTVQYGIVCDGNARDGSAPNGLQGLRNLKFSNTDIFNATVLDIEMRNVRSAALTNIAHFQGAGSLTKLSITGATAPKASYNIRATGCSFGDLSVDQASLIIMSACNINAVVISANASVGRVANAFGSVSNSGTNFTIAT